MFGKGSESMKKLRFLTACIVICSMTLTFVSASEVQSPKIVFADSEDAQAEETSVQTEKLFVEYEDGENNVKDWLDAIEGFFSVSAIEETNASAAFQEEVLRTWFIEDTTFVSIRDFVERNYPDAVFTYDNGKVTVSHDGFYMEFVEGNIYYYVNGRILPLTRPCFESDGCFYVPIRALAYIYSYDVSWDEPSFTATLNENGKVLLSGEEFYDYDDYILLAKLIRAESGNQPLEGKIAVGNVVMNRVKNSSFPDSISGVIYDRRSGIQFTTAYNGSLNAKPTEECLVAAKLCLEGYSVTDDSLYFFNPDACSGSWIRNNKTYVTKIGNHVFYS